MRISSISLVVLFAGCMILGCRSSKKAATETDLRSIQVLAPLPNQLKIVCGQGGGFTGNWQGYTIALDGLVTSWNGSRAEENPQPAGQLPVDSLQVLWNQLFSMDFFDMVQADYANLTAVVEVQTDEETNRVTWPPKLTKYEPLETPLDSFYVQCTQMASSIEGR